MSQTKRETRRSPIGITGWTYLHAPDTKFNEAGAYQTKVIFDPNTDAEAQEYKEYLDEMFVESQEDAIQGLIDEGKVGGKTDAARRKAAEAKIQSNYYPYTMELDEETGEETGRFCVNYRMTASGIRKDKTRWTRKPRLFDAKGQPVPVGLKVGSGSRVRVAYEPNKYFTGALGAGFSCRLQAVQVIELKTWDGPSAAGFGFDSSEEGFSVEDAEANLFSAADVAAEDAGLDADKDNDTSDDEASDDDF